MGEVLIIVAQFTLCSALILGSGVRLSRYGDVIANKTGLGGTWIGLVLMASVTSLPELVTGSSAVLLYGVPDIAAGDIVGSCLFNLAILALLDVRDPEPLTARVHQGQVLAAGFGIVQIGLLLVALVSGGRVPAFGWIGALSLVFWLVYLVAVRTIFVFERARVTELAEAITGDIRHEEMPLRRAVWLYAAFASVLVVAASLLPGVASRLADVTGWSQGVVGTLFVAVSTSLPEIVVSMAAMRIGAVDMAVANLFGSNLFNVAVIGLDDVLYTRGPILADVSPAHAITLGAALVMTGIAIVGMTFRAKRKRYRLSWDGFAMIAVYVIGVWLFARAT